jgi:N-acetylmuramoyl-L-alanine amidase
MNRKITEIIVHCSATPALRDVSAATIDLWHRKRGFYCIGYHFVVRLDGTIENGRDINKIGAHCLGHNAHSIGICYVGGCDADLNPADTRTPAQKKALIELLQRLKNLYPNASIFGHRDFAPKACPCFDAKSEYSYISKI